MRMQRIQCTVAAAACAVAVMLVAAVATQSPEPKPAFSGQTDAPAPATPSPAFRLETVASGLTGAWSLAFLPDGNFLVTRNGGTLRLVRPDGFVSAPIEGPDGHVYLFLGTDLVRLSPRT
jgi:glucose/arabinose dehydrogenase